MYDDLAKRLREYAKEHCPLDRASGICGCIDAREAADAIEELLRKEKFHAFLWNVINPNDMQLYLEMYHSGNEKEDAG